VRLKSAAVWVVELLVAGLLDSSLSDTMWARKATRWRME